jgi:hypothetical protein
MCINIYIFFILLFYFFSLYVILLSPAFQSLYIGLFSTFHLNSLIKFSHFYLLLSFESFSFFVQFNIFVHPPLLCKYHLILLSKLSQIQHPLLPPFKCYNASCLVVPPDSCSVALHIFASYNFATNWCIAYSSYFSRLSSYIQLSSSGFIKINLIMFSLHGWVLMAPSISPFRVVPRVF